MIHLIKKSIECVKKKQCKEKIPVKLPEGIQDPEEMLKLFREQMNGQFLRFTALDIIVIGVLVALYAFGIINVPRWFIIGVAITCIVASAIPLLYNKSKKVTRIRVSGYLSLIALSFMIAALTSNGQFNMEIIYVLPVIASCLFLDPKLTRNITVINYGLLAISQIFSISGIMEQERPFAMMGNQMSPLGAPQGENLLRFGEIPAQAGRLFIMSIEYFMVAFIALMLVKKTEELIKKREEADMANAAKSTFLANMSHEIRTPMNAIMGFSQLIMEKETSPEVAMYASNIRGASINLLDIINDVLDISKIESGKVQLVEGEFETAKVFYDVLSVIGIQAKNKNLELKVDVSPDFPRKVYADEGRIRQILINILNNAVKYTREGYVRLEARAFLDEESNMSTWQFAVEDSGIGIKPEDVDKLFDEFVQVDMKKNRSVEGTGLGLSIAKHLAQLMGGDIWVTSEYGKGSTFFIRMVLKTVDAAPMGDLDEKKTLFLEKDSNKQSCVIPSARILVVDDNRMNLSVFKGLMEKYQNVPETAQSGQETLELLKENTYDLIFLDQMMPGMDGVETLKQIRLLQNHAGAGNNPENAKMVPIVALTADAVNGVKDKLIALGFTDYLSKPIDNVQLEAILRKYLPAECFQMPEEEKTDSVNVGARPARKKNYLATIGVDSKVGISHCGSRATYLEVLRIFIEEGEENISQLQKDLREEDFKNYTIHVHGIKSSLANIGATELSELAREHEYAGKEGRTEWIKEHIEELVQEYNRLIEGVKGFFEERKREEQE